MRKALSLILSILFLLTTLPLGGINVSAASVDNLTYKIADGAVTITGYTGTIPADLVIPATIEGYPVTAIRNGAFELCDSLTSVTIGDSVTSIGNNAFYYCDSLTSVTIGDGVTTIGASAFQDCYSLTSVTIGDSVTTIGDWAFSNCYSLTSVTIGDGVTTIGDWAFYNCGSLASVTIPDSVTTIGDYAFWYCYSLTSVTIGDGVTTIGHTAFQECYSLTSVTIGDSVSTIGEHAFFNCYSLTSVTIPDSVTTIGMCAFAHCTSLTSVTIGDRVTTIGYSVFYNCTSLTDVYYGCTETDKANISIGEDNDPLLNAMWHYHEHSYDNVCDAGCNDCGDIRESAHAYDHAYDTDCNECGAVREVVMFPVTFGGNSVSEDVSGLAFKFTVDAIGMTTIDRTTAVYDNATVKGHRLLSMGAVVSNAVESVDIPAVYLFDWSDTDVTYAVRLINIPADQYDTTITAVPYFVLEIDGVATTIYGEAQTASINGVMNA